MIGALRPARPHAPKIRTKDNYWQKEEHTGNFEPNDAAHATEGAKKTAQAAGDAPTGLGSGLPGGLDSICCVRNGLGLRLGLKGNLPRGGGFHRSGNPLAGHLARDAQSCAKDTANNLSSHTVYDGSSEAR